MKDFYKFLAALILVALISMPFIEVIAGNKDRSGQAGAPELLINPYARGTGWGSANVANVRGLEGMFTNIAGLAFTNKTEVVFSYTNWLKGTDISISSFGLAQRIGESGVLGISVMSMGFGDLDVTTTDQPEGTGATYSPNLLNVNIAYAKAFSNSIYAGINLKIISHSIPNASAMGVAIDAGITYVAGKDDQVKFGVVLKNLGPEMKYTGDGFSIKALFAGNDYTLTVNQRSEQFELPTQLKIGASYDFLFGDELRFTLAGTFASNSFTKDQFVLGGEFSLKSYLMVRAGYTYENNITESIDNSSRTNVYNGPSAGLTVQVPFNKEKGSGIGFDYSYQSTASFNGTHVFGVILFF